MQAESASVKEKIRGAERDSAKKDKLLQETKSFAVPFAFESLFFGGGSASRFQKGCRCLMF